MPAKMRIGIVASEYNYDITRVMHERAVEHARFLDAEVSKTVWVPGVYDMPVVVKHLLDDRTIDGVVTLGAVVEGETEHDQLVISQAARKLVDLAVASGKPVALGISGPGMSRLQALERVDKAKEAVESAVKLWKALKA